MKHLIIRNLGPLKEADIEIKRINVIIGSQSSGKSCLLKTACYCTWVEKRIELTQTVDFFAKDGNFLKELEHFHKLKGYINNDTFISYESDFMIFSYDNALKSFQFSWKKDRWNYHRSKVTYIPAERNLVAAIPNWFQVKFADDNIRDFMADWETARQATTDDLSVLNLGVSYHYDANTKSDKVEVADNVTLDFTYTSSGLQSVIPLFVHLHNIVYNNSSSNSIGNSKENQDLLNIIYNELFRKTGKADDLISPEVRSRNRNLVIQYIGQDSYIFKKTEYANECEQIYRNYTIADYCDIFLEEPEENLFPPTQTILVEWLIDLTKAKKPCNLFIATHSPYILETFLEKKNIDVQLLYTRKDNNQMLIKTATKEDLQNMYDYGLDAFFNMETLS